MTRISRSRPVGLLETYAAGYWRHWPLWMLECQKPLSHWFLTEILTLIRALIFSSRSFIEILPARGRIKNARLKTALRLTAATQYVNSCRRDSQKPLTTC